MIDKVTSAQGVHQTGRVSTAGGEQRPRQTEQTQVRQHPSSPSKSLQNQDSNLKREEPIARELKGEDVADIVDSLNQFLEPSYSSLKFNYHEDLDRYFVTVVDKATDEVIREIPPEKMLDMYAKMAEQIGLMVDKKI